jgi:uncharacterized protein YecT (DUF1311 family)
MLSLLLGAALASSAAPPTPLHARWRACVDTKTNNMDYGICGGAYVKAADAELNVAWKALSAAVAGEPQTKAALLSEQRAWLAYRNTACAFYSIQHDWGREGEVLDAPECVGGVLERRTAELKTYLAFVGPNGQGR